MPVHYNPPKMLEAVSEDFFFLKQLLLLWNNLLSFFLFFPFFLSSAPPFLLFISPCLSLLCPIPFLSLPFSLILLLLLL